MVQIYGSNFIFSLFWVWQCVIQNQMEKILTIDKTEPQHKLYVLE